MGNQDHVCEEEFFDEGVVCPNCTSESTRVRRTEFSPKYFRYIRTRECKDCGCRWFTKEVVVTLVGKKGKVRK